MSLGSTLRRAGVRADRHLSVLSLSTLLVAAAAACSAPNDADPPAQGSEAGSPAPSTGKDAGPSVILEAGPGPGPGAIVPPAPLVDCTIRANDDKDPKCVPAQAGTVGSGPKFSGGLTTQVNHGFISGNQLVLAVEFSGTDDEYGGIFGVDMSTGERKLLAGKYNDPVNGEVSKGTGPAGKSLNQVRDVAQGPNGKWIALASQSLQSSRILFSIDPATGDRTVLFDSFDTPCTGIANNAKVAFDYGTGLTVAPDGSMYLGLNNLPQSSGKGIAKVTPDGKCSVVTLSGATVAANNKGTGPNVIGSFLYNVTYRDDALYLLQFNTHSSILKVDPATGNRTMVSVSPDKGMGPDLATDSMAIAPDGKFWTYHAFRQVYGLVSVDPATGDRTRSEPKGGPAKKAQGPDRGIYVHPDGKHLLLQYGNAIIIYDTANGNSNTLSY